MADLMSLRVIIVALQGVALAVVSKWCQEYLDYATLVPLQWALIFSLRPLRHT
jgi:hypothetical protein